MGDEEADDGFPQILMKDAHAPAPPGRFPQIGVRRIDGAQDGPVIPVQIEIVLPESLRFLLSAGKKQAHLLCPVPGALLPDPFLPYDRSPFPRCRQKRILRQLPDPENLSRIHDGGQVKLPGLYLKHRPAPGTDKISDNRIHPPPRGWGDPGPASGTPPGAAAFWRCVPLPGWFWQKAPGP